MEQEVLESLAILKMQQMADAVIIKCLLATAAGAPLADTWKRESSNAIVDEQLSAHSNKAMKEQLPVFQDRLNYWGGIIRSLDDA